MKIEVTGDKFDTEVFSSEIPVLVDFWAPWCGPCKMLGAELEALDEELGDNIKIVKVNADTNPHICARYQIMSIPTMFLVKEGRIRAKSVGYTTKDNIKKMISEY